MYLLEHVFEKGIPVYIWAGDKFLADRGCYLRLTPGFLKYILASGKTQFSIWIKGKIITHAGEFVPSPTDPLNGDFALSTVDPFELKGYEQLVLDEADEKSLETDILELRQKAINYRGLSISGSISQSVPSGKVSLNWADKLPKFNKDNYQVDFEGQTFLLNEDLINILAVLSNRWCEHFIEGKWKTPVLHQKEIFRLAKTNNSYRGQMSEAFRFYQGAFKLFIKRETRGDIG